MRVTPVLLGLLAIACADESLGPRRSVRLYLEVATLEPQVEPYDFAAVYTAAP